MHNGVCASPAITINICPYVTYNDSTPYGNCYVGKTLNNLYYVADKAVPKDISITTTFTYNILRKDEINPDSCIYDSDDKTNTYTIISWSTESYIKPNVDVLHKFATANSSRYGYENYFSTSFLGTIAEDTFTYDGQEYIINLSDIPCSTDTTQPSMSPECGTAINGSYSSAPRLNLCAVGDESVPTRVGTKWKWTCTYGGVSTGCSAGYNPITIAPECGTSLDKKCDSGTLSGSSDTKWECVSGNETVCCTRSCTTSGLGSSTTTYSCPSYYKMGDDGKCHLYAQFCADDIVCTDDLWGMYGCDYDSLVGDDNPSNKGCGSNSCFGDSKQKADGNLCVRRDSLEYDEYASTHYLYRPVASHHFLTQYNYSTEEKQDHKCAIKYTLDEILSSCRGLQPSNSQDDNGYYIDSCDGGSIPETVDPCSITSGNSGGSTTTCTISQSSGSCKNFEPDIPIIGGACQKQCSQCYDNLVDCNENRPDSATSECMEGSPGNSLECYCYKPASTAGICWLTTMYGG